MILPSIRLYSRYMQGGTHGVTYIDVLDPDARSERYLLALQSVVLVNIDDSSTGSQIHVASGTHKLCTQA
jgi:hypothetical protein